MPLVENLEQVVDNASHFTQIENAKESSTYKHLNSFQHWYYFRSLGKFAPGKFIGYVIGRIL